MIGLTYTPGPRLLGRIYGTPDADLGPEAYAAAGVRIGPSCAWVVEGEAWLPPVGHPLHGDPSTAWAIVASVAKPGMRADDITALFLARIADADLANDVCENPGAATLPWTRDVFARIEDWQRARGGVA